MSLVRLSIVGNSVIEVDRFLVTPASSHLFGLLLFLSFRAGRPIGRQELQTLFAQGDAVEDASHSLRQLLYRLRQFGLRFEETPSGLNLRDTEILGPLDQLRRMELRARCRLTVLDLEILPSYVPRLPRPFMAWLDDMRSELEGQIRQLLLADLEASHVAHSWADVVRLGETLASLDPANGDVVRRYAEALAMTGRREAALEALDSFILATALGADALAQLQSARARIAKMTLARREGTLRARATCLSFLEAEWERVATEGARVTAVLGHAGLGKTRVAEEFAKFHEMPSATSELDKN